jgi:hypothetical protein
MESLCRRFSVVPRPAIPAAIAQTVRGKIVQAGDVTSRIGWRWREDGNRLP